MKKTGKERELPLEALVVVDLTRQLPGPLCTQILGDYGAEVIKVEDTAAGDPLRLAGRFKQSKGAFFRQLNRNKKSLALDLKSDAGREVCLRLMDRAAVLVEGFRPGVMERLGLAYPCLSARNPGLVYVSLSGYGQEGPYRDRAGHDLNYIALAGLLDLGAAAGEIPPVPAVQVADIGGGSLAALAGIMFALYKREKSGEGTHVDVSMLRGLLPWLSYASAAHAGGQDLPRRESGYLSGAVACYNVYETADGGYMSLAALEARFWENFCRAVDRPQWIAIQFDPEKREELIAAVRECFREKTRQEWEEIFASVDACCEPVLTVPEAMEHPANRAGGHWIELSGPGEPAPGFPLLFGGEPGRLRLPPPGHGEHSREILTELGYGPAEIEALITAGTIKAPDLREGA